MHVKDIQGCPTIIYNTLVNLNMTNILSGYFGKLSP